VPPAVDVAGDQTKPMPKSTKLMLLAPVFTAALFAQHPFGTLTSATPPDPATIVANKVARLTSLLTLTAAQQSQATIIFTNALDAITPLQTTISTDYTSLQAAVKSNASATIDQLASAIGTAQGQILSIQNKADAAFYAILTADQQTKLSQTSFLSGPGQGFGRGPGGPPPGR
jgi:Spy/CpxP family protein refolding chaperone